MASRRDELRAHQFLRQRAVSALVIHETDPETPPFRRPTVASYWSLGLALIGLAAAGVVGMFVNKGSASTFKPGQNVLIVNGSGATAVFLNGQLHYLPNITSAELLLKRNTPTQGVDPSQLDGIPHGTDLGIPGAPAYLPAKSRLLHGAWTFCSVPTHDAAGDSTSATVMSVGSTPPGGQAAGNNRAVLVRYKSAQYLVWHGYRHLVADRRVIIGLNLQSASSIPVSQTLLNTLPIGPKLAPVKVPGFGSPSTAVPREPGVRTGDALYVELTDGSRQYYLVQQHRLQPITEFQVQVQKAALHTRTMSIDPSALPPAVQTDTPLADSAPPPAVPQFVTPRSSTDAVCAVFAPGNARPQMTVGAKVPTGGRKVGGIGPTGTPLADRVVVQGGSAALVRIVGDEASTTGTLAFVGDNGLLYPLGDSTVPGILGYAGVKPVRLAATVAARMPLGPALSTAAAAKVLNN